MTPTTQPPVEDRSALLKFFQPKVGPPKKGEVCYSRGTIAMAACGEGAPALISEIELHVAMCPGCNRVLVAFRATVAELGPEAPAEEG